VLFGILALCGLTWFLLRKERAPVSWAEPPSKTEPRERVATLAIPGREPTVAPRPAPTAEPEPEVPAVAPPAKTPFAPALPFDWPQLGGSASHLGLPDDAERRDQILVPRVRFTFAMLMGQPTVRGTELFAGGITLARVDLKSDEVHEPAPEIEKRIEESAHELRARSDAWAAVLRSQGFGGQARVAAAPALAGDYVLARMLGDGSVSAFDRELTYEAWRWEPSDPGPCPLSGSLAGDLFLVPHRREVVALRAPNGSVEWRFEVAEGDQVVQVPASDGDLVYFATERGVVYALELARGKERWRAAAPADPGWTLPLAFSDRLVLLALRRDAFSRSSRPSELRAFQSYDGRELWRKGQGVAANAGGSGGEVWLVERGLTSVSAETGQSLWSQNTNTLYWRELQVLRGAPKRVGDSLVALEDRDLLVVREVERGAVRWAYRANASLLDFVHAGEQIYLATDTGLLCLADDPAAKPEPPGHVYGRADPRDAYLFRP
jgi:outer membrane protein assembly factor BamB